MDSSPETRSLTHPREPPTSSPRSSCWTTPVKSETVTLQSWIATPPILPANSPRSRRNAIVVPAKLPKRTPSSSNLVMLPWLPWFPPSPCASNPSLTSPHWVVSLSVTCVKPSLSESSSPSTSRFVTQIFKKNVIGTNLTFYIVGCHRWKGHQGRRKGRKEEVNCERGSSCALLYTRKL